MLPLNQQLIGYQIHYSKLLDVLNNQRTLAYHLALLSRMVYGYKNAHRSQKYYQAIKSVNSHMRRFANMDLKTQLSQKIEKSKEDLKNDVISEEQIKNMIVETSSELIQAFHILSDARNQCMNSVIRSRQILAMGFFISLHSTLIAISSSIYSLTFPIQNAIKEWFMNCVTKEELKTKKFELIIDEEETKEERKNENQIKENKNHGHVELNEKFDVGQVISREMFQSSTKKKINNNGSPILARKRKIEPGNEKPKKLKKKAKKSVEEMKATCNNIQDKNDIIANAVKSVPLISQNTSLDSDVYREKKSTINVLDFMIDKKGCDSMIPETSTKNTSSKSLDKKKKKLKALKKKNKLKKLLELK